MCAEDVIERTLQSRPINHRRSQARRKNVRKEADVDADDKHPWRLSKRLRIKPDHGLKLGGWRLVALRFEVLKADDAADARVDDILVDPRMRY